MSLKMTFGEMRAMRVRGILIYCSNYKCSHWSAFNADEYLDEMQLSDIAMNYCCTNCGTVGADVRPNFASMIDAPKAVSPPAA